MDEVNKLRGTLLKSGQEGKQAWADMKGKGIEFIKENSQISNTDEAGNTLFSQAKLNKTINSLDDQGKLDAIYGNKNAQILRDIGDLAADIYTAPPGSVNHSNTASALQVALDTLGTFAITGGTLPAPVATTLTATVKHVKNKKARKRIRDSLHYLSENSPDATK